MIYFDAASSTKPRAEVLSCFQKACEEHYANPSSPHALARADERELSGARQRMLSAFGVSSTHQAIFLSGASEANNLALKGIAFSYQNRGKKILVGATEHPSVLAPARYLAEQFGFELIVLPVDEKGCVRVSTLQDAMDSNVILVSIMGVNNETGAVNDLAALAHVVHGYPKAFFHSDLTQAIGKIAVPFSCLDLFSFSAHKIHGLKGSGALIYKKNIRFVPLVHGGGQEMGARSGTVAVPLALACERALSLAVSEQPASEKSARLLWNAITQGLTRLDVTLNSTAEGSPFVCNFSLNRHKASVLVEALSQKDIYVSSLSACSSKSDQASSVLLAMGYSNQRASNAIRVSFDESNSLEEVGIFLDTLTTLLREVRPR